MNAKHLFLTVTMLLTSFIYSWGVTDVISFTDFNSKYGAAIIAADMDEDYNDFSGYSFTSGASYSGSMYFDSSEEVLGVNPSNGFGTTVGGGYAQSVKVYWDSSTKNGRKIYVFASDTKFSGDETKAILEGSPAKYFELGSITYTSGDATGTLAITPNTYKYIMIIGDGSKIYFTQIDVTWTEITRYDVYVKTFKKARGTLTVDGITAAANTVVTRVEPTEIVTLAMSPKEGYALISYTFDDMEFDLSCVGYIEEGSYTAQFPMPARNCTINVVYEELDKDPNAITITYDEVEVSSGTVKSGKEKTFNFELDLYKPDYDGVVSVVSANEENVIITDSHTDFNTGKGYFTVKGLKVGGPTTINVVAAKTATVYAANKGIDITVENRQIALVTDYDGKYYVMNNTVSGGEADAQEVVKSGESYFYSPGGAAIGQLTWNAETQIVDEVEKFSLYSPVKNKYLGQDEMLLFKNSKVLWGKNKDNRFVLGGYGAGYSEDDEVFVLVGQNDYKSAGLGFSKCVEEVDVDKLHIARRFTSNSGIVADIHDDRTLAENQIASICVPFDVPAAFIKASGAGFYTITSKTVSGGNLTGIVLDSVTTGLVAGHSYIFIVNPGCSDLNLFYESVTATEAYVGKDGFIGNLGADPILATGGISPRYDGHYGLSGNQLHYVSAGATGKVKRYRAMIDAGELDVETGTPAPARGRKILRTPEGQQIEDTTVALEDLSGVAVLDWNQPVYNVMGVQVAKGSTGVLIQNGVKFIVQ